MACAQWGCPASIWSHLLQKSTRTLFTNRLDVLWPSGLLHWLLPLPGVPFPRWLTPSPPSNLCSGIMNKGELRPFPDTLPQTYSTSIIPNSFILPFFPHNTYYLPKWYMIYLFIMFTVYFIVWFSPLDANARREETVCLFVERCIPGT